MLASCCCFLLLQSSKCSNEIQFLKIQANEILLNFCFTSHKRVAVISKYLFNIKMQSKKCCVDFLFLMENFRYFSRSLLGESKKVKWHQT